MTDLNPCYSPDDELGIFDKWIVIIGAGISGIACACHLRELGFRNVQILEARNRVGGRIYGIDLGSKFIELGAQWIHGETDNIIYEIAESNGLVNKSTYNYLNALRNFSNFSSDERKVLLMLFDFLEEKVNNYSNIDECNSLPSYLEEQFQKFLLQSSASNFSGRLNEGFEWYCKFLCEVNGCHDLASLSLNLLNTYKECDGNQTVELKDGFSNLLRVFLELMPPTWILKNKTVTKVDWSDFKEQNDKCYYNDKKNSVSNSIKNSRKIKVICSDEETFLADHVVVTIPLGCLKKLSKTLFVPSLSENKRKAILCLGFGAINKVYLEFKEIFWEPFAVYNILWEKEFDGLIGQNSHKLNTHWLKYIDRIAYTPNHPNFLCVWIVGDGAAQMELLSENEVSDDCMKFLQLLLKKNLPKPCRLFRSSWMSDPFSCGSYSYLSVDCEKENVLPHDLAEPEYSSLPCPKHPVLLFAGEATHDQFFSTVHGAYESGLREAERILHHYRPTKSAKIINSWNSIPKHMSNMSLSKEKLKDSLHIVIVGAGLAGLACALELSKNNFSKISILEAQDRIGGRLQSTRIDDTFLELGAQWIHGSDNALFEFLKSHDLLPEVLLETSFEGEGKFCTSDGRIIPVYIVEEVKKIINNAKTELEKGCYDKNSTESVFSFFLRAFKSHVIKCSNDSDIALKKALFNWCVKFESIDNACDHLSDIAVQSFTEWDECPEELYHIEFSKGSNSLVETLASLLPRNILQLKKPVKTVKWCENLNENFYSQLFNKDRSKDSFPVVLECENGDKFYADCVVVTASVGFLKENVDSFFFPSLPENKLEALEHVAFGTVNKIFLIFDEPFWHSDDMGFHLVWESKVTGKCEALLLENPWICDITGFDVLQKSPNILLGWIGGEGARLMETVDEESVGKACSDLLRIFLNRPDIPYPCKVIRSCWHTNPYIRGSYSSRTLKYYQKDSTLHDLQQPIYYACASQVEEKHQWPVLLFAGEAFDGTSFSSAHGAFRSGLKAAEDLISSSTKIEVSKENTCSENGLSSS